MISATIIGAMGLLSSGCLLFLNVSLSSRLVISTLENDKLKRSNDILKDQLQAHEYVNEISSSERSECVTMLLASEYDLMTETSKNKRLTASLVSGIAYIEHLALLAKYNKTKIWQVDNCVDGLKGWVAMAKEATRQ